MRITIFPIEANQYSIYEKTTTAEKTNIDLNAGNYKMTIALRRNDGSYYRDYSVYPDYANFQIKPNKTTKLEFTVTNLTTLSLLFFSLE
jgi:hypothetical protein